MEQLFAMVPTALQPLINETNFWYLLWTMVYILIIAMPVLGAMAYLTWAERKVLGWMHLRHGPMHVGPYGLLQPIADAVKLMFKEPFVPGGANKVIFLAAPVMIFVPALLAWAVMPFGPNPLTGQQMILADINLGVLYLMAISSLGPATRSIRSWGRCAVVRRW
jgi:NADH-quinone oxidoreductase subunit H